MPFSRGSPKNNRQRGRGGGSSFRPTGVVMPGESRPRGGVAARTTSFTPSASAGAGGGSLSSRFGQLYGSGSNGPASHRPSPARRSVHRSGAGANNRVSPSSSNRPLSSGRPPRRNNRNRNAAVTAASRMMDVDQGNAAPIASRPGRSGRRRGGGGRREGSRGGRQQPASRENLDKDLEKYMMRDAKAGKAVLDNDLDAYMMGTSELVALPGGNL